VRHPFTPAARRASQFAGEVSTPLSDPPSSSSHDHTESRRHLSGAKYAAKWIVRGGEWEVLDGRKQAMSGTKGGARCKLHEPRSLTHQQTRSAAPGTKATSSAKT